MYGFHHEWATSDTEWLDDTHIELIIDEYLTQKYSSIVGYCEIKSLAETQAMKVFNDVQFKGTIDDSTDSQYLIIPVNIVSLTDIANAGIHWGFASI